MTTAQEAFRYVVENAGVSLWRDEVDDYVIDELLSLGTEGATISNESELGLSGKVGNVPGAARRPIPIRRAWRNMPGLPLSCAYRSECAWLATEGLCVGREN